MNANGRFAIIALKWPAEEVIGGEVVEWTLCSALSISVAYDGVRDNFRD